MRRINKLGGPGPGARRVVKGVKYLLPVVLVGALSATLVPIALPQTQNHCGGSKEGAMHGLLVGLHRDIEQFKARSADGQYPDLIGKGWEVMYDPNCDGDFSDSCLWRPPENYINDQTAVWIMPSPNTGWHYDRATGVLGACYFDEETSTFTETP